MSYMDILKTAPQVLTPAPRPARAAAASLYSAA